MISGVRLRLVKSTADEKDFKESSWSLSHRGILHMLRVERCLWDTHSLHFIAG
jgi:hypothetical protein